MPIQTSRIRPSRSRARKLGTLGVVFTALLSPAGKIVFGTMAAAALIGGVAIQLRAPSPPATQVPLPIGHSPIHLAHATPTAASVIADIESDGKTLPILLVEGFPANSGPGGPGSIPGSAFLGLPDGGTSHANPLLPPVGGPQGGFPPAPPPPDHGAPGPIHAPLAGDIPPSPYSPPGTLHNPAKPIAEPSGGPAGGSAPTNNSGIPNPPSPGSPAGPVQIAGPGSPAGDGSLPNEAGAPAAPQGGPGAGPNPGRQPATPTPPNSGHPPTAGDPLNPPLPTTQLGPLRTADQPPAQIQPLSRTAVPEPSMLGLMLMGIAALAWKARRRPARLKKI